MSIIYNCLCTHEYMHIYEGCIIKAFKYKCKNIVKIRIRI